MLWAWELPEDLRFIQTPDAGVAFLATSLLLRNDSVLVRRRMQPLRVAPNVPRMAVFRIDSDRQGRPTFSAGQRAAAVDEIESVFRLTGVSAIQIDFDARASERAFYRLLLQDLRSRLGRSVFLSITALVSWCGAGSWLNGLPVDEIVPMLFRMGPEGPKTLYTIDQGGTFPAKECRDAWGLSLDEPPLSAAPPRRVYVFNARPWTPASVHLALSQKRNKPQ